MQVFMKRFLLSLSLSVSALLVFATSIYIMERGGKAVFTTTNEKGETLMATNANYSSILRHEQASFAISLPIRGFVFDDYMLVDQFASEAYLNANKDPMIRYNGKFEGLKSLNMKELKEKTVPVSGQLRINGVDKDLNTTATLNYTEAGISGTLSLKDINLSDFNIELSDAMKTQFGNEINLDCELLWAKVDVPKKE